MVFRTLLGQPINADYLAKHFRSILDVAGLPRIRLYDLRHSAATIALAAGVSPKVDIYEMINAYWEELEFNVQEGTAQEWKRIVDTALPQSR